MPGFAHLHVHTEYSLLDGAARIKDLIDKTKESGMDSIAITDHGVMYGVIDFYRYAKEQGIKPIIGCEVYVAPKKMTEKSVMMKEYSHLVLLAKNNTGYKNLMKLVSLAFLEGFYYKPRIDYEVLQEHSEGLICLSACLAGDVPRRVLSGDKKGAKALISNFKRIFKDDFYIELQDHGLSEQKTLNPQLIEMAEELGVELVATNDVHYVNKEDAFSQDVLMCVQMQQYLDEEGRLTFQTDEFYLKTPEEMQALFQYVPQALENTRKIADQCDVSIDFDSIHLPFFKAEEGYTNKQYLKMLCQKGLKERYGEPAGELEERLSYELGVIEKMGFTDYFLIVWDFIRFAREKGIMVGPGRGSAAGSIVAYALRITDIDPIRYKLLFERFLNPERVSMPDIDIDFCIERRQEVIDYVIQKYGADKVAQIITFGTLGAKQVIRDVARVMRIPPAEADRIAKMVPFAIKMDIDTAMEQNPRLLNEYQQNPEVKKLIDTAKKLEGLPRHASTHAAGVVISRLPVTQYVPLQVNPKDGSVITQFPMNTLESLGLLKMDFLGLRNLTVIRDTIEMVYQNRKEKISIDDIQFDDKNVFDLIASGDTDGVFQLESAGMRNLMQKLKPTSLDDIMVGISLFRPGPMDSIPDYLRAKKNPESVQYDHPMLEKILKDTYGCIVYQEQVMEIVRDMAGYSLGRSDLVRRAMSKKKAHVMAMERNIFIHGGGDVPGAVKRGVPERVASKIFDNMMDFAQYAFNKSHACAYAVIGYYTAYLKCYFKLEFITALLNSFAHNPDKIASYIQYCKKTGVQVKPPDINKSFVKFTVEGDAIRFGLASIRAVGEKAAGEIVRIRKSQGAYTSFHSFVQTAGVDALNKKSLEGLITAGCFDGLGMRRSALMGVYDRVLAAAQDKKKNNIQGQLSLFDTEFDLAGADEVQLPDIPEYAEKQKLALEKIATGVYLSGHPLDEFAEELENMKVNTFKILSATEDMTARDYYESREVELVGILNAVKKRATKQKQLMAMATLEDLYASIGLMIFPSVLKRYEDFISDDSIVKIKGKVDIRDGEEPQILVNEVVPFVKNEKEFTGKKLYVRIPHDMGTSTEKLENILGGFPGKQKVILHIEQTSQTLEVGGRLAVTYTKGLMSNLKKAFGKENVVVK